MTRKEKENLNSTLFQLAGKINRLSEEGKESESNEVYRAVTRICRALNIGFFDIQVERNNFDEDYKTLSKKYENNENNIVQ